jgi:hypothetical protein
LEQEFAFARFTLHVVDGVAVLYIGIETENHKDSCIERLSDWVIGRLKNRCAAQVFQSLNDSIAKSFNQPSASLDTAECKPII